MGGRVKLDFQGISFKFRYSIMLSLIRKLSELSISKRKSPYLLVMFGCRLELSKEDVRISEVTVCSSFSRFVPKLPSNIQSLEPQSRGRKKSVKESFSLIFCAYTTRNLSLIDFNFAKLPISYRASASREHVPEISCPCNHKRLTS